MKEIEDKIQEWEANKKQWEDEENFGAAKQASWLIKGMRLALHIINRKNDNQEPK